MIKAIKKDRGVSRARAICDDCGREEVVAANVDTVRGIHHVNEGQVKMKLAHQGWAEVKGKLRCPICEAKRKTAKSDKEQNMADVKEKSGSALRQPTTKQVREIIAYLEIVYDDEAKRFKPGESDKTVAEAIGNGCLWGWVAEHREKLFGPDTRNQEMEAILSEVKKLEGALGSAVGEVRSTMEEVRRVKAAIADLRARLDKVAA